MTYFIIKNNGDKDAHRANYRRWARPPRRGRPNSAEKGCKSSPTPEITNSRSRLQGVESEKGKSSLGRIFRTLEMCCTTLLALVLSVHDEFVHVLDCDYSTPHGSAKNKITAILERASCWNFSRAQNPSVYYNSAGALQRAESLCPEAENHIKTLHTENPLSGATSRGELSKSGLESPTVCNPSFWGKARIISAAAVPQFSTKTKSLNNDVWAPEVTRALAAPGAGFVCKVDPQRR